MLQSIHELINTPAFYFCTGIVLLALFFWYLAAENEKVKRNAGAFFIIGLSAFSLLSLILNGMNYGIDISGGVELTLEVQPKMSDNGEPTPPTDQDMQQACDILNERLNSSGTSEVQIIHSGNKILIQIPQQDKDPERNKTKIDAMVKMLTKMAKLELLTVYRDSTSVIADADTQQNIDHYEANMERYNAAMAKGERMRRPSLPAIPSRFGLGTDYRIYPSPVIDEDSGEPVLDKQGKPVVQYMVLESPVSARQRSVYITGENISRAAPAYEHRGTVNVVLNNEGASNMGHLTGKMELGRDRMAVVLNNQIKCAPTVQSVLHKDFQITGLNGKGEPEDISKALANPLTSDLKVEGRKDVSAQLGKSALEQGEIAGLVGMVAIFFFCFWYYRTAGIVAMVGLSLNALVLLGLMSLFGFVLTLPGIAGIVLTMGVAVDANVLIYERMREERRNGRPFIVCLRAAYEKAFSAIWDSNVTSLITAVILFWLASGSVKGFAVTTSVGIITSLIGAIVVTRVLFFFAEHLNLMKEFKFSTAPLENKKFDFMKYRKFAAFASTAVLIITMLLTFFWRGNDALGIDFTGGTSLTYSLPSEQDVDYKAIEKTVQGMKLSKIPTVQEFASASDRNVKIRCANNAEAAQIDQTLRREVKGMQQVPEASQDVVSASLGSSFFRTACLALLVALVGITLYLSVRFELSFAMGALISIMHDVVAIIGLLVVFGTELSIIHIGAFLTVAGYSINDTIVIYDRIRERLRLAEPNENLLDIMNDAVNSTLSRTILTSLSTIAALVALLAFGGPAMRDFSMTMLLGVLVGTYSSVYIASPAVYFFSRKHDLRAEIQSAQQADSEA